jgi:long-chain fatty acid transport protein
MKNNKRLLALAVSAALAAPMAAHATNGMNLEGYGPIAMGMGGASMAYDNGSAAMMNNPATLGLMDEGNRLDVAVGFLNPTVTTEMGATDWDSSATSFMMPALGWAKKSGKMTYGVGMFSQGGMGAEYSDTTSPGGSFSAGWMTYSSPSYSAIDMSTYSPCDVVSVMAGTTCDGGAASNTALANSGLYDGAMAAVGLEERSEVGVGRLLFPFTYEMKEGVTLGASIDYVWAGMDLQMAMNGMMMGDMMMNPNSAYGSISGTLPTAFAGLMASSGGPIYGLNYGYFDFSDNSSFSGEAKGAGFAGKIGATFKVNQQLTIGATYHSKTSMSDLETSNAKVSMSVLMSMDGGTTFSTMPIDLVGDIAVKDFQWPATMALGMSYQANDKLMIAADVKRIQWADVMADFTMEFTASQDSTNNYGPGMDMRGADMTAVMYQDWEDQTVISLGAAYKVADATTVRVGYNSSTNPVPDETMNYLFPAVTETAYTLGVGHVINDNSSIDVALSHVPEVTGGGDNGFTTSMSQTNYQLMYSYKF